MLVRLVGGGFFVDCGEFAVTRWGLSASELRHAGGPRVNLLNTQEMIQ